MLLIRHLHHADQLRDGAKIKDFHRHPDRQLLTMALMVVAHKILFGTLYQPPVFLHPRLKAGLVTPPECRLPDKAGVEVAAIEVSKGISLAKEIGKIDPQRHLDPLQRIHYQQA